MPAFDEVFDPDTKPDSSVENWTARVFASLAVLACMDLETTDVTMEIVRETAEALCNKAPTEVMARGVPLVEYAASLYK